MRCADCMHYKPRHDDHVRSGGRCNLAYTKFFLECPSDMRDRIATAYGSDDTAYLAVAPEYGCVNFERENRPRHAPPDALTLLGKARELLGDTQKELAEQIDALTRVNE